MHSVSTSCLQEVYHYPIISFVGKHKIKIKWRGNRGNSAFISHRQSLEVIYLLSLYRLFTSGIASWILLLVVVYGYIVNIGTVRN